MAENTPLAWRVDHFFETFRVLHNLNLWDLEEAGVITPGAKGGSDWKRFNGDLTTFILKLPAARVEKLFLLIESRLVARPTQDAETIQALREQLDAADRFRMLFVTDSDPVALTLEVDTLGLANAFDELSKASATARAALSAGRA